MTGDENCSVHTGESQTTQRDANDAGFISGRFSHSLTGTTTYNLNIIYSSIVVVRNYQYNLNTTPA